ncbi:MAG: MSHA biogenesis protein MshO [Psychromonas sp.]|jgi:MSHA biogenesis protein MshO|uniref:PulJ/GspJ family protein n=1 Tax=Psychromonas sp. TaxID=1884585 RepID=UPI0039E2F879
MAAAQTALQKGFTLIELVMVIIILSALGIMTSSYIGTGVDIYTDITQRDRSLNSVRFVMERLRREVSNALPNSAVVTSGGQCLTFTPIIATSLYGSDFPILPISKASGAIATIPAGDYSFESGDKAVVYLLSSDEITNTGKVKTLVAGTTNSRLMFVDADGFALASPAKRIYIIRNNISYYFSANQIFRGSQCDNGVLMAANITGSFAVEAATLQRNGLVQVTFNLDFDGQEVPVEQTIHINNVP